jgi:hypothetical protein
MIHGGEQSDQSTTSFEVVDRPGNGRESSQAVVAANDSAVVEEKERTLERVEQEMEVFQKGECSRFQASSWVANELEKWVGATDKEKGKAFDSYLAEINSLIVDKDEDRGASPAVGTTLPSDQRSNAKWLRDEVKDLLDQVSREELEGEENERRVIRKRAKEEDMPWYNSSPSSTRRGSCVETCKTLLQFSEDLSGVKSLLRVTNSLPEGIPTSQWDHIIRGQSVDLYQILSAMHFIQLDEERKGCMGGAEVLFSVAESKRQVKTGGEWSSAYRQMSKAVAFLFTHRREELFEYAEYIEGLFSAKHANAHPKVILYDQSVRNRVGGGQNILLTDYQSFTSLSEAILHADGIKYTGRGNGKGSSKGGKGADEGGPSKKDVCRRFNSQDGCRFTDEDCYYKHVCKRCGKGGHGKASCTSEKH